MMPSANDLRAQKRAELGLSPQRPTAKPRVQRPPSTQHKSWMIYLLPAGLLVVMAVTVFLLWGAVELWRTDRLAQVRMPQAGLGGISDWSWARLNPPEAGLPGAPYVVDIQPATALPTPDPQLSAQPRTAQIGGQIGDQSGSLSGNATGDGGAADEAGQVPQLLLSDNFAHAETIFAARDVAGQWRTAHIPHDAVYRMEIWPGHVAWSLLDPAQLLESAPADSTLRMQSAAAVALHTPWAYVGLIARAQTPQHMILFVVDGHGRYTIQLLRDGEPAVAVPWTAAPALYAAGTSNVLTIEDDGTTMRFFGNQYPLYQMNVADWPQGNLGIAGGALPDGVGESRFEWFQLYAYE